MSVEPTLYVFRTPAGFVVAPFRHDIATRRDRDEPVRTAAETVARIAGHDVSLILSDDGGDVFWAHGSDVPVELLQSMRLMRLMQPGDKYLVEGNRESNTYVVRGHDPVSDRYWLCVDTAEYDGYNGDLIVQPDTKGTYTIVLADDRCGLRTPIKLLSA